jgi:hypothetical protein
MRPHYNRPESGAKYKTNQGCIIEVIDYVSYTKVLVKFLDGIGHKRFVSKKELLSGSVKNPFHPEVNGVGFFGVGPYIGKVAAGSKISSKEYSHWHSMLTRSYAGYYHERFPTYVGCSVDEQWHNFQEFAEWCQWQTGFKDAGSVLDKDLLVSGNKVYGIETCVFLPPELNNLIVTQTKAGKDTPPGISYQNGCSKYIVSCAIAGKNKNLGRYKCPEEAFAVYKAFKEALVKEKAEEYKDRIDIRAYTAMLNFKVQE